ncbi:MAG: tripartite tricarboxylate transporter permease [Chloroflexi bacterium]|nr:tripartite tricarboxylate transporter permease [Chloroflexota bacterium]MCI0815618.1 tripartite tricarboxylate transporter permease [Chloroflexota bacterium]
MPEMLQGFIAGLSYLGNGDYWFGFFFALALAVPVSLIPGISATLVMAITIPFIVVSVSDPVVGLAMLAVLTGVDNTLDSIPAILLGMPGGATQVTFLEGNQLAHRGKAAHTLGAVYAVSAMGGLIGAFSLALIIPVIAPFVLAFGFAEIAAMAMFGVAMVAALSGGAMLKGIFAGVLGLLLSTVGPGKVSLDFRYMFDQTWLFDGLPLIATTIGVFALPEIIDLTMTRKPLAPKDAAISYGEVMRGARYGLSRWRMTIRQSLFGVFLGAVPGIGSGVVDWMSYAFGIFWTKDKSQFGKGSLDGVLFAESAQNAKEGGQAIPTLALGIPGGRAWAFVIVAMTSYGIAPGQRMLQEHADITIMIVMSLGLGNLAVTMLGLLFTRQMARLTLIPYPVLGFLIIPISLLAAFQDTRDLSAITIVLIGTGLGMLMKRYKWPRPPLLIGFILGPIIESNIVNSVGRYDWVGTFTRPLFIVLFVISIMTAALFTKFMARTEASGTALMEPTADELPEGLSPPSGAAPDAPSGPASMVARARGLRWAWSERQLFTGAMVALSVYVLWEGSGFSFFGRWFPIGLGVVGLVLSTSQFVREGVGVKAGDVMDIGMRSQGLEGARTAGAIFLALLTMMLVLTGVADIQFWIFQFGGLGWGAFFIALLGPPLMMRNKTGLIGGVIGASVILFLNIVFFDYVLAVFWPEPFILDLFR